MVGQCVVADSNRSGWTDHAAVEEAVAESVGDLFAVDSDDSDDSFCG